MSKEREVSTLDKKVVIKDIGNLNQLDNELKKRKKKLEVLKKVLLSHWKDCLFILGIIYFANDQSSLSLSAFIINSGLSTQIYNNFEYVKKYIIEGPGVNYNDREKGWRALLNKEAHKNLISQYLVFAISISISVIADFFANRHKDSEVAGLVDKNIQQFAYPVAVATIGLFNIIHREAVLTPAAIQKRKECIEERKKNNIFTNEEEFTNHLKIVENGDLYNMKEEDHELPSETEILLLNNSNLDRKSFIEKFSKNDENRPLLIQ